MERLRYEFKASRSSRRTDAEWPPEKFFTEMQGIDPNNVAYAQDEYGRPFIIIRDQKKMRIKGLEAQKVLISDLVAHFSSQSYYFNLEDIFGASRYWKLM